MCYTIFCMSLLVLQRLFLEAVLDIIYFPLWWYTGGALHALRWCFDLLRSGNDTLAPGLWLANIFTPMYGQSDWQGRIISFIMRAIQVLARGLALIVWLAVCVSLFFLWLIFPIVIVWGWWNSFLLK